MDALTIAGVMLGAIWGVAWALFLERSRTGRFMAVRLTWLSVVIGIGVDLLIALLVIDFNAWWRQAAIIAASSVAIIWRSLGHYTSDHYKLIEREHGDPNAISE